MGGRGGGFWVVCVCACMCACMRSCLRVCARVRLFLAWVRACVHLCVEIKEHTDRSEIATIRQLTREQIK